MTLDPHGMFRRQVIGEQEFEFAPVTVYDSGLVPAGVFDPESPITFRFCGHPRTAERQLVEKVEEDLLAYALAFHETRGVILSALGLEPRRAWCLLGAPRKWVSDALPPGKPGDFDLIAGHRVGGRLSLDLLVEAEVKRRPVGADGSPRSLPSGLGVSQATGATRLGFDRVMLLHLLCSPQRPLPAAAPWCWQSLENADFIRSMRATVGMVRKAERDTCAAYGLMLLGWADLAGTAAVMAGALCPVVARTPPFRPMRHRHDAVSSRAALTQGLRRRLGSRRPWAPVFRLCRACGDVFAPTSPRDSRCC